MHGTSSEVFPRVYHSMVRMNGEQSPKRLHRVDHCDRNSPDPHAAQETVHSVGAATGISVLLCEDGATSGYLQSPPSTLTQPSPVTEVGMKL